MQNEKERVTERSRNDLFGIVVSCLKKFLIFNSQFSIALRPQSPVPRPQSQDKSFY